MRSIDHDAIVQFEIPIIQIARRVRRLPAGALLSGPTAAWLHGVDVPPCDPIEVTLPKLARTSRLAGVALIRSDVAEDEICLARGLRATSPTRTFSDLARRLPLVEAVVVLDMALHRGKVSVEQLQGWAASHAGYPGIRRLRRAIDLADGASESPMETRLRLLLVLNGLPRPALQVRLSDSTGMFLARPDLYYARQRLAIEYDGGTHRASFPDDNRRQNRLLEAGYGLLRFAAGDIFRTPAAVVGQVERALNTRPP